MVGSAFKPEIMNVLSWIGFLKERVSSLVLSNDCDLLCGAITRVKVVLKYYKRFIQLFNLNRFRRISGFGLWPNYFPITFSKPQLSPSILRLLGLF